jgi:molybdopterin-guanine dinucleotide biosynthesis protein A
MTGTVATQVKAIAFDRDIERLTEGFTGREWVFEEIGRWLQQGNERFFILTGEPGVGKSAIAAQLVKTHKEIIAAYHFCIAGRSGTIEPNNVLLSLAAQLIDFFPDYAEALVNTIKPLKLSVNVEITIENLKNSQVRGVVIENLHTQNPQEALNVVLRRSLAALPNPPQQSKIILIDSLDEAVTFSDQDNLVTLLAGMHDLPSWVRLILTSRPEDRVIVEFEPLKPYRLKETSEESLADIWQYVEERVEQQTFQERLKEAEVIPQMLIEEVTKLSSGNFLYTKLLLNDIEAGQQALNEISALPKSIDDIYLAFLRRFKSQEWKKQYQPILGTLTVTQEPVTEDALSNFTGLRPRQLRQDLGIIRQFLDVVENAEGEETRTYAIFHQSLRDYLLDKKRNKYFWCDAQEQHELIIEYYRGKAPKWEDVAWNTKKVDDYGLQHLATHLYRLIQMAIANEDEEKIKAYREELYELICKPFMWSKFERFGSHQFFAEDVKLSIAIAQSETPPNLVQEVRSSLLYSTLGSLATDVPPEILGAMTSVGQVNKAKSYASLILDPEKQSRAYQQIGEALLAQAEVEEARKLILNALMIAEEISYEHTRIIRLNELLPSLAPLAESDRLLAAAQTVQDEHSFGELLSKFVPLLIQLKHFDRALVIAQAIPRNWSKGQALSTLAQALAEAEDNQRLNTLLEIIETRPADWIETSLLSVMAEAFIQVGNQTGLDRILLIVDELTEVVQQDTEVGSLAKVLTVVKDSVRLNHLLEAVKKIEDVYRRLNALNEVAHAQFEIEDQDGLKNLLKTVEDLGSQLSNSRGLSGIAYVFSNLGDRDALHRLLKAIQKIESEYSKAEAMKGLIEAMANTKNKEGLAHVLELAKAESLSTVPENLVKSFALVLAEQGELAQALDLSEDIEDGWSKGLILETVALKMLQEGEVEQALQLLNRLERQQFQVRERIKMRVIALTLIQQGKFNQALAVIESTNNSDNWDWESTLNSSSVESLAQAFAEKENKDGLYKLVAILRKISNKYKEYDRNYNHNREYSLRSIAVAFAQIGEFEHALATVNEIESEDYYAATDSKEDALCKITSFMADVGDKNGLEKILAMLETVRFPGVLCVSLAHAFAEVHEFEQALTVAERIGDELKEANAFIYIAQKMIQAGHKTNINQVFARTKMITSEYWRAKVRTEISQALAQAGELEMALQATVGIGEEEAKAETLSCIIHEFAQVGKFEYAISVLELIQQEEVKSRTLIQLIPLLAKETDKTILDQLLTMVKTLNEYYRVKALIILLPEIVQLDHKNGLNQAIEVVQQMIEAKYDQFEILSAIAQSLINQGDRSSFNQALELAEMVEDLQPALFAKIAPSLVNTKDKSVLYEALLKIEGMQDEIHKTEILTCVAQGFAQLGDKAGLNQISEIIDTLDEKRHKEVVISKIATALAQMNEIAQAFSTAEMIEDDEYLKAKTLGEIANILAKMGQTEEAITTVATIDIPDVLSGLAKTFAQMSNEEGMIQMLDAWAKTVQDPTILVERLFQEIAPSLAQVGKVDLAIGAVNYILLSKTKAETLVAVVQVLASSNNHDGLNQFLEIAREITEEEHRTTALAEMVQCFAQISEIEQALSVVNEIKSEWSKMTALSEAMLKVAQAGETNSVEQIFKAVQLIDKKYLNTDSLSRVAQALTLVGLNEDAFLVWRNHLAVAQLAGRSAVFEVLTASTPFLSVYDQGETLWSLHRTVQELESWWITQ